MRGSFCLSKKVKGRVISFKLNRSSIPIYRNLQMERGPNHQKKIIWVSLVQQLPMTYIHITKCVDLQINKNTLVILI